MTQNIREKWRRRRRRREKGVKPNPWLDSLLAVHTIKSSKVYCTSICKQSNEGLYSPRKPQKALLLPDLPMFLWSQGATEHVLVSLLHQLRCNEVIWGCKSASAIWPQRFPCLLWWSWYLSETSQPHSSVLNPAGRVDICPAPVYHKPGFRGTLCNYHGT